MKKVIIVEGKSDTRRLKEIYPEVITFETSGLGLDNDKIDQLKKLESAGVELICFTDPDYPGERIRQQLTNELSSLKHAFVPRDISIAKNGKIGIESATEEGIINALDKLLVHTKSDVVYTLEDLMQMGIVGNRNRREKFCDILGIANGNNKKVLKQMNTFGLAISEVNTALKELNEL